jgi:hypothetical protein
MPDFYENIEEAQAEADAKNEPMRAFWEQRQKVIRSDEHAKNHEWDVLYYAGLRTSPWEEPRKSEFRPPFYVDEAELHVRD